jgi:hypothetical protein
LWPSLDDAKDLVTRVALRTPHPWFVASVERGTFVPQGLPEGRGLRIVLQQWPPTYDDWKEKRFERAELAVMAPDHAGQFGQDRSGLEASAPIANWRGGRVYQWYDGCTTWPSLKSDVRAAFEEAEPARRRASWSERVAIGPVTYDEVHINTDDFEHGFHCIGHVTDTESGKNLAFDLHFMHPLFGHVEESKECGALVVYTNRFVAFVPLSSFRSAGGARDPGTGL